VIVFPEVDQVHIRKAKDDLYLFGDVILSTSDEDAAEIDGTVDEIDSIDAPPIIGRMLFRNVDNGEKEEEKSKEDECQDNVAPMVYDCDLLNFKTF
jgi:hypothetical protein